MITAQNKNYTVTQAADILGISAGTLRLWERQGKITSQRTIGGQRRYSPDDLKLIKQLQNQPREVVSDTETVSIFPESPRHLNYKPVKNLIGLFLTLSSLIIPAFGFKYFKKGSQAAKISLELPSSSGAVLAAETALENLRFTVNIPAVFNKNITAPNIIYGIKAGTGINITPGQTPTISTTGQNSFQTITADNTAITATSPTDTLTLAAGSNISFSTDASNKKITISAAGADPTSAGWTDDGSVVRLTTSTDNVGIGTANPASKLHVAGALTLDTALTPANGGTGLNTVGTNGQVLTIVSGSPAWADNSSTIWTRSGGTISPTTSTDNLSIDGDMAINGGDLTTSASTFNLVTGATTINIGAGTGNTTVNNTLNVTGTTFLNGIANIGDGGDSIALSGTTISLTANGAGNDITANLVDNNTDALDIQQGTNNYININTTDSSENISFGNATTNPSFSFLGSGNLTIAAGSSYQINNTSVLSATTLGSGVINSSLTSVGTIGSGVWQGTKIAEGFGGTNQSTYATGDILYASATDTLAKRTIGSPGQVLVVSGGVPTWGTISGSGCTDCVITDPSSTQTITPSSSTATGLSVAQASSGSVDIFNVTNNGGGTKYLKVDSTGKTVLTGFQLITSPGSGYALISDGSGNGSWTDITTSGTIGPWSLTGVVLYPDSATSNVLIGSTTTADSIGQLTVTGAETGKALTVLNETGDQNILAASASGTTVLTLGRTGILSLYQNSQINTTGTLLVDSSGTLSLNTTNNQAVTTGTGLFTTAGNISVNGGSLTSTQTTFNLLTSATTLGIGAGTGNTTVNNTLNVTGTTNLNGISNIGDSGDTIALSGTTISLTANGANNDITANLVDNNTDALDIQQSTNNYININTTDSSENISFGNATTNPSFSFLGSGTINIAQDMDIIPVTTTGTNDLGSSSLPWDNIYASNIITGVSGTSGFWQRNSQALSPTNITDDVLTGATATSSALIKLTGTAGNNSWINTGNVGIGNTSPVGKLDVSGAVTGKALVIFNETGDQNILTASQSGIPVFNLARVSGTAANGFTFTPSATGNAIAEAATGSDTNIALSIDGKGTGALNLNNTGTGDILIGGGSGSTGCTITNSNGNLVCAGTLNGITASSGTISSGTWNGSVIGPAYGGTGVANNAASTLTISGNFGTTLTVSGTTSVTLPTSGTLYGTATGSITSSQLLTSLSDETGTGVAVFGTSPAITTSLTTPSTTFSLVNATATTVNFAGAATTMAIGASSGTITIGSNSTINGGSAANDDITIQGTSNATRTTSYVLLQPTAGNVGIGNSSPTTALDVTGTVNATDFTCSDCLGQTDIGASAVGTSELKTATSSTSGSTQTNISMNDYNFFPSFEYDDCTSPGGGQVYSVNTTNATNDTVGRFQANLTCGAGTWDVRWRDVTASDHPTIWVIANANGSMRNVWESEDPIHPTEYPKNPNPFEGNILSSGQYFATVAPLTVDQIQTIFSTLPQTDQDQILTNLREYIVTKRGWLTSLNTISDLNNITSRYEPSGRQWAMRFMAQYYELEASDFILNMTTVQNGELVPKSNFYTSLQTYLSERNARLAANETERQHQASLPKSQQNADLAELYSIEDHSNQPQPGDIVSIASSGAVLKSSSPYDSKILGIISTSPDQVIGKSSLLDDVKIALAGRVPVKISPSSAPIQPGDLITSSSESGLGMKATHPGQIIGKALESWSPSSGTSKISVFVNVTWADPNNSLAFDTSGNLVVPDIKLASTLDHPELPDLTSIKDEIASISAELANLKLATPSAAVNIATDSAQLTTLSVTGTSLLSDTNITGKLTVGFLKFDDLEASLSSVNGTVTVKGDLAITGSLKILGASAGKAVIPTGSTTLSIQSALVSSQSAIFVTPESDPIPVAAEPGSESGQFNIKIPNPLPTDLKVNWWIVN